MKYWKRLTNVSSEQVDLSGITPNNKLLIIKKWTGLKTGVIILSMRDNRRWFWERKEAKMNPNDNTNIEKGLSLKDIMGYLGVSRESIFNWIEARGMPGHKGGDDCV